MADDQAPTSGNADAQDQPRSPWRRRPASPAAPPPWASTPEPPTLSPPGTHATPDAPGHHATPEVAGQLAAPEPSASDGAPEAPGEYEPPPRYGATEQPRLYGSPEAPRAYGAPEVPWGYGAPESEGTPRYGASELAGPYGAPEASLGYEAPEGAGRYRPVEYVPASVPGVYVPAGRRSQRRPGRVRAVVGCVVVAGVAAAVGIPVFLTQRDDAPDTTFVATTPEPVWTEPPPPTPDYTKEPTPEPALSVDYSGVVDNPDSADMARSLSVYFDGVDNKDFSQAYAAYTPEWQARVPFSQWAEGVSTTDHSNISLVSISYAADATPTVEVLFRSTQAADKGPRPGETCTDWSIAYTLERRGSGAAPFLIAGGKKSGFGSQPC